MMYSHKRGDEPPNPVSVLAGDRIPPHSWDEPAILQRIFLPWPFSHTRGDEPQAIHNRSENARLSHTRGDERVHARNKIIAAVFPPRVGITVGGAGNRARLIVFPTRVG
jgi:hypothetical protein